MLLTTVRTARRGAARRAGFTLLEVLVVVAIIVILAGVASIAIFRNLEEGKVDAARTSMQTIEKAVKQYYLKTGDWPPNNDLTVVAPYLEQGPDALRDPWGGAYELRIISFQDQVDGQPVERPQLTCRPPGKPEIMWPTK